MKQLQKTSLTKKYFFFSLSVLLLVCWAISITYISNYLSMKVGFDPLTLIGSGAVLGPKKIKALEYVIYAGFAIVVFGYIITLLKPQRLLRLLILCVVAPLILVNFMWLDVVPLGNAQARIQMKHLPSVDYDGIFNDEAIHRNEIQTYEQFAKLVDANYLMHKDALAIAWNIKDEDTLKTYFYINTVANLFSFGNKNVQNPGGCAALNEQFGEHTRDKDALGIRYYMDSQIGCCTDYMLLVEYLLNDAGIKNRKQILRTHGHWFNEVFLQGKWRTIDANIGVVYDRQWNEIVETKSPFAVIAFPVISMNANKPERYRPLLAQFRQKTLMVAAIGAERTQTVSDEQSISNIIPK